MTNTNLFDTAVKTLALEVKGLLSAVGELERQVEELREELRKSLKEEATAKAKLKELNGTR